MKTNLQMLIVIIGLMTFFCASVTLVNAQAPQAFNYQTVVRNSDGEPIQNQAVAFRISIVQDSPGGTVVYQERHLATTSNLGLATLEIGKGTVLIGTFSTIGWSAGQMYLKVEVDPTGSTSYLDMGTTQLLSVPYALHAQSSSSTSDVNWAKTGNNIYCTNTGNVGIGTGVPKGKLSISPYQGGTEGSLVSTYTHQLVLGGTYDIGANQTGIKLWIGDYNNDGTDVYPIYCEDENNKVDFWIKSRTNQTTGMSTMFFDGRFGIGTTSPANSRLHLEGANSYDATIRLNNTGTNGTDFFMSSTSDTWGIGGAKFVMGHGLAQSSNVDFALNSQGNIGIGTTTPEGMLHLSRDGDASLTVEADANNNGEGDNPRIELRQDGKQVIGALGFIGSSGEIYPGSIANSLYLMNEFESPMHFGTDSLIRMTLSAGGLLGINTDSPLGRLSVEAQSGTLGIYTSTEKGLVVRDGAVNSGNDFEVQSSTGAMKFVVADAGNVGIGTDTPEAGLHIKGDQFPNSFLFLQSNTSQDAGLRFYEGTTAKWHIYNSASNGGLLITRSNIINPCILFAKYTNGYVGIGTNTPASRLDVRGNVTIRDESTGDIVVELGTGLDYAEGFNVSEKDDALPGTVLCIDPENPGKLMISSKPYDTKVAGIVAGANELGSGIVLGKDLHDCNVALAGRVYCNVDATKECIQAGDLLTTSSTPGYAMKVTDHKIAQGAILGKAMESIEKGERGKILVLVTLQ